MRYTAELGSHATLIAQRVLHEHGLLRRATVACTYTDDDNMTLSIVVPMSGRPPKTANIGFADFRGTGTRIMKGYIEAQVDTSIKKMLREG